MESGTDSACLNNRSNRGVGSTASSSRHQKVAGAPRLRQWSSSSASRDQPLTSDPSFGGCRIRRWFAASSQITQTIHPPAKASLAVQHLRLGLDRISAAPYLDVERSCEDDRVGVWVGVLKLRDDDMAGRAQEREKPIQSFDGRRRGTSMPR